MQNLIICLNQKVNNIAKVNDMITSLANFAAPCRPVYAGYFGWSEDNTNKIK